MQSTLERTKTVDSSEIWSLQRFVDAFGPHISPELLANILIDVLGELEEIHRQGKGLKITDPDAISILRTGEVRLTEERTETSPTDDLNSLISLFQSIMLHYGRSTFRWRVGRAKTRLPEAARIHPIIKNILMRRYSGVWQMRAALLDFLSDLDIDGERFFLKRFIREPLAYNQDLALVVSARECVRITESARWGRRRVATQELRYLLEVSPGNPKALELLRMVKQGRRRAIAQVAYVSVILLLLAISGSVILSRAERGQPLVIEPAPTRGLSATRGGFIDVSEEVRASPTLSLIKPGLGQVALELDQDARAYFDAPPSVARPLETGSRVWLSEGDHSVTIIKPGYPQAIAQVRIKRGHLTTLTARATAN